MSIRDKNILRVGLLVGLPTDVERHNRISGRIVAIKYDYVIVGINKKQNFLCIWI